MVKFLFAILFLAIQGSAIAVAAACQGAVCNWMDGGHWVSPAVRIPVVAAGVIVAEILLLMAAWPSARKGSEWLVRHRHG